MQLPGTSGRYTSTDPKLLHWTLADSKFAKVVDASGKETGAAVAGIGAPMFYPIPNPAEGGPDHILTSNEGEVWAVGKYDPQTETMTVQESQTAERPVFGLNYLVKTAMLSRLVCPVSLAPKHHCCLQFTATGQAKDENRLLSAGWLWQGNWAGSNRSGCAQDSCGTMGTGFSLVRDLRKRGTSSPFCARV